MNQRIQALVTGANGHLGCNIVRSLLERGHRVRAFVRETSDLRGLEGLDIEYAKGDLLDADSLKRAADGCDWLFHAGAIYRNFAVDPREILDPSINGTRNAVDAAATAGVSRFIHTSSIATVGYTKSRNEPFDESHHMRNPRAPYIRAKCEAEQLALELGANRGVSVVVVNPGGNMGPWDYKPTPTTKAVADMANGEPSVLDVAPTHVADLAEGHVLAAEKGASGERYLLTGENLTRERVAEVVSSIVGRKVKALSPPMFLLRIIAWNEERKARKSGGDAAITREILDDVGHASLFYDSSKAKRELGWSHRDGEETIRDTLRWLKHAGMLSPKTLASLREELPPDPSWR